MPGDRFDGRVALVTGGGSGIGRAAALALAEAGAAVVVAGRRAGTLAGTVAAIERIGGRGQALTADVTVEAEVAELLRTVVRDWGAVDVAVNCAGVPSWGPVSETDRQEWDHVLDVNLTGVWLCMKYEIQHMRARGSGAVVNVASRIGAQMREPYQGTYAASKAAVVALTRTAARECVGDGVRVNAVSPGPTDTAMAVWSDESPGQRDARVARMCPIGRLAAPAEIAAAIRWLASDQASYVVGHDLVVDGGISA